jgi:5-(carboxyamino)imidazole ribonucleotide mutase
MKSFVAILMGSASDSDIMRKAEKQLAEFDVPSEVNVRSAHRQHAALADYVADAESRGVAVYICGAGMAAALPGVVAALTTKPVIGVPIASGGLGGLDALLAIAQMPKGVPVACVAVDGAQNAALLAVSILAAADPELAGRLAEFRERQARLT